MKKNIILLLLAMVLLCGCSEKSTSVTLNTQNTDTSKVTEQGTENMYSAEAEQSAGSISASEAEKSIVGNEMGPDEEKFAIKYEYTNDDILTAELKSLMTDYIRSLYNSVYSADKMASEFKFDFKSNVISEGERTVDFVLDFKYREYGNVPDEERGKIKDMTDEYILTVQEKEGYIMPETMRLFVNTQNGLVKAEETMPESNSYFGTISFEKNNDSDVFDVSDYYIVLKRQLWVSETGGYAPDGYFIADLEITYNFPVFAEGQVTYLPDGITTQEMSMADFVKLNDTKDKVYDLELENGAVRYIIEQYRP